MRLVLGRRTVLGTITGSAAAAFTGVPAGTAHAAVPASPGVTCPNTIADQRAAPHIYQQGLTSVPGTTIWIHLINGKWYIHGRLDGEEPHRAAAGHLLPGRDDLPRQRHPLPLPGAARPVRRSGHQPLQSADAQRRGGEERRDISDSVGVSYESHSLPGRYLRHYDYLPHVQPLGTATNRADAAFSTQ